MAGSDYLRLSEQAYRSLASPDGRKLHWVLQVDEEIPIAMHDSGLGSELPKTLADLIQEAAALAPDQEALRIKREGRWVSWTYSQYNYQAHCFARALASLGIQSRKAINIFGFNTPEWLISFIGAILADCVPVGIYVTSGPEAVQYIAEHSEAELVVVHNEAMLNTYLEVVHLLPNIKAFVVLFPHTDMTHARAAFPHVYTWHEFMSRGTQEFEAEVEARKTAITPGRVASIIYTSGTTGPPKGVLLSHDNYVWTAIPLMEAAGQMGKNEQIVSFLPLSHIAGQMCDIAGSILKQACLSFADERALQGSLGDTLREVRPTWFLAVPRVYEKMEEGIKAFIAKSSLIQSRIGTWARGVGQQATLSHFDKGPRPWGLCIADSLVLRKLKEALGLERVKACHVGAAPMPRATLDFFASLGITILNVYGLSETTGPTTINSMQHGSLYSVGAPLPSTTIKIIDEQGRPVANGTRGEVCCKGRNKFLGYFKNLEATTAVLDSSGLLHTGDEGYLDERGFLFITGRFKELIITTGGENVPPVPIEQKIKENCRLISNVFVVGDSRRYLGALITLKSEPDASGQPSETLLKALKPYLAEIGSSAETTQEAVKDPKILACVDQAVSIANQHAVSRAAHIRRWAFILGDFTIAGGELTPTTKVRRRVVSEKYKVDIEQLYVESKL
jgi:long-chain-fatty-acid--CoA ligase ACSBG